MNTFIMLNGVTVTVGRFMQAPVLRPGREWVDKTPLGSGDKVWHERMAVPAISRMKVLPCLVTSLGSFSRNNTNE